MVDEFIAPTDKLDQEKSDRSTAQPTVLFFENVTIDDFKALASSTNGQQDTTSDVLPVAFLGGDEAVLVAQKPEKTAKELIAEFQKIDKQAAAAFEKRPTFEERKDGKVIAVLPDWASSTNLYGKEIEILEELAKKPLNEKEKQAVNNLLMRALRRFAFSASQLSTVENIVDPNTGAKPTTAEREQEVRDTLRKAAGERFQQLWNMLKGVQGKEGDKATVLLEWGENYLHGGKNKEAETKFQDALKLFDKLPEDTKGRRDYQVRVLWDLGSAQLRQGDSATGLKHLAQAVEVLKEMGKLSDVDLFNKEDLTKAEHARKLSHLQNELSLAQARLMFADAEKKAKESPTVERLLNHQKTKCPWGNDLLLVVTPNNERALFIQDKGTIELGWMTEADIRRRLEQEHKDQGKAAPTDKEVQAALKKHEASRFLQFVYNLYLSTHQEFRKLYDREKPIDTLEEYRAVEHNKIAAALLATLEAKAELGITNPTIIARTVIDDKVVKDKGKIDRAKTLANLIEFLREKDAEQKTANPQQFQAYWQGLYNQYKSNFAETQKLTRGWLNDNKHPAWRAANADW